MSIIQYISNKNHDRGIKIFVLADAESGYVYDIIPYKGKENGGGVEEEGLGARMVMKLCQGLEGNFHILATDRFFSSPNLCEVLLSKKIYHIGTVRSKQD